MFLSLPKCSVALITGMPRKRPPSIKIKISSIFWWLQREPGGEGFSELKKWDEAIAPFK